MIPPSSSAASTRWTRRIPRLASTIAHSIPAGPAPTTSTSLSPLRARVNRSGCQPRRYSSPAVGFWVQTSRNPPILNRDRQMLQPMHSRISSGRPSSILRRQERIGDRGPGGADDVELARVDRRDHHVGIGEAADADDRLVGVRADLLDPWLLVVLRVHTRGGRRVASCRAATAGRSGRPTGRPGGRRARRT